MQCICGKEFESKRKDAKYCSQACQKRDKRDVRDNIVRDNIEDVRDNPISNVRDNAPHPDRDNIYSKHFDISEEGFIRRNKAWLDASRFSGTPAQQEAARKVNREQLMADNIRINREHVAVAVSEAARRMKQEAAMEAMRKVEG